MSVVAGNVNPNISITQTATLGTAPNTPLPAGLGALRGNFLNGTGADQFALVHSKTYAFAASTPQTINLFSGALLDMLGNPTVFSSVRFFLYRLQNTLGFPLTVGGAGTDPWNGFLVGSGKMIWSPSSLVNDGYSIIQAPTAAGMAVNSGSCQLLMDPGANTVGNVDLIIVGS